MVDNAAICDICCHNLGIEQPNYENIDLPIVQGNATKPENTFTLLIVTCRLLYRCLPPLQWLPECWFG